VRAILEADFVLVSGGGFLNDNYRPAIIGRLFEMLFAHALKKPVGIYSHSMGPFNSRFYRTMAKFVFCRMQIITLREKVSAKLVKDMDVDVPIAVVPDAAFAIPLGDSYDGIVLEHLDGEEREMVSISVREWDYYTKERGHKQYIDTMSKLADALVERGYRVIFCSTCSGFGGYARDDRITADEVIEGMKQKDEVLVIRDHLGPSNLIGIYSRMKFHIGTRMHSNIFALLGGTPVVAIGYEHKTMGMMEGLGMENLVFDINEFSHEDVLRKADDISRNYDDYKVNISRIITELRKEAMEAPILILDAMKNCSRT
jgi:colanic acid/amylovoran biosynthesis protein